jgi:hypothetical protein
MESRNHFQATVVCNIILYFIYLFCTFKYFICNNSKNNSKLNEYWIIEGVEIFTKKNEVLIK